MSKKDPLRGKKIFIGFNSAGSAGIYAFTRVLRRRGYQIDFYGIKKLYFDMPVDFLLEFSDNPYLSFFQRVGYFLKIFSKYDVWHFNFMEVFFFYPVNLFILKLLGKKIVVTFRGIDVQTDLEFLPKNLYLKSSPERWPEYYQNQFLPRNLWLNFLKRIRREIFIWFADQVILTGPFLAGQVSRYDKIIPYAREVNLLAKYQKNNKNLKILHIPSDPVVKGTEIIEKTFKILQKKYPKIEFKILEKIPREKLLLEMASSDIIIDQLLIGWYGGQAVEAMALGKVVMAFLNPVYFQLTPFVDQVPIWNTNIWTFRQDLEMLLRLYPYIKDEWQKKTFEFAKKEHDALKIASLYLKAYQEIYGK